MNQKRLFVGNLTYSVDEAQLWGLFSRYGEVVGVRILEGKGYGFVEMESSEDARAARNALNETEFKGRNLLIDDVKPRSKVAHQKNQKFRPGQKSGASRNRPADSSYKGRSSDKPRQGERRDDNKRPSERRVTEYKERVLSSAKRPGRSIPVEERRPEGKRSKTESSPAKKKQIRTWGISKR